MKSRALNIFISALIALSAFFFAADFCLAEEEFITQPVTVSALSGKVEVLPKDALNWQKAEIGIKLFEGDKIRTAEDGKAELTFKDGSFIRMKPNTTLGVLTVRQEVSTEVRHYNLELRVGEIMAEVQKLKKGSSFEVQTPTAVAAVRGTTYYMRTGTKIVDGVEKSFVEIFIDSDDTILFTNTVSGESCVVTQGQGTIVYDDGTTEGPFDIPPEEQDAWKSGFDIVYDDSNGDVDDTTNSQNDSQEGANQDQTGEQDITGLAKVDIITDSDGDGYLDADDAFPTDPTEWLDTDGDGTGNNADTDDDNDGMPDEWENDYGLNPLVDDADGDPDEDNLANLDEYTNTTEPNNADTDGDTLEDGDEVNGILSDGGSTYKTDPTASDTDGDGIDDNVEMETAVSGKYGSIIEGAFVSSGTYSVYTSPLEEDTDGDGISDLREQHQYDRSNPAASDTDGDGIEDIEDAFPYLSTEGGFEREAYLVNYSSKDVISVEYEADPDYYGSKDNIREELEDTFDFGTYNSGSGSVSGGIYDRISKWHDRSYTAAQEVQIRNELRADIESMLGDNEIRRMDAVKEKIADAQMAKVIIDAHGYRVRSEQYILRPDSYTVELLNITLRTVEASDNLPGLHTLDWKTQFNASIDGLSGQTIRNLPWNDYLDSYETSINSTAESVYPTNMNIKLKHNDDSIAEVTNFETREVGASTQRIESKKLAYNLYFPVHGRQSESNKNIRDKLGNFIVSIEQTDESSPQGFYYWLSEVRGIYLYPYIIGDNMAGKQSGYSSLKFNTLGDMLKVNMAGANSIGANNLEIEVKTKEREPGSEKQWQESDSLIDIIYFPYEWMDWNDDLDWSE